MSSPLISLAWDGHHRTLVRVFEKILVNSHTADCTIAADGQNMKAHREILSGFSPFFELLFSEETDNNPTVIISGISFRDLRSLVDFMYQGKLEVTEDRIQDLIDAAECLQIKGLGGGHKEDDSGDRKNNIVLPHRPALSSGVPHKRTRKGESEEAASIDSEESDVNNLNYRNELQHDNSVITCGARRSSCVQNVMPNSDVQNVAIVSNVSLMPAHSTQSEIEMDSSLLHSEYIVKEEPDLHGDDNINELMRDTSKIMHVFENSGRNSCDNGSEESILGLSSDISVQSEKNTSEDLPLKSIPVAELCSELCSRGLTVFSVKNDLVSMNVNLSSVEPVDPALEKLVPLLQSEFHMKTTNETLSPVDSDLISGNVEFSENMPESIGVPSTSDIQMKVVKTEKECDISDTMYTPQDLPAAFVKVQREGRKEAAVGVNPHDASTRPSHTPPVCDRDLAGPSGRDVSGGRSSTDVLHRCRICNRTFNHNRRLNAHMRIHIKNGSLPNVVCDNPILKLNEHQHNESRRKSHKCTVCDFKTAYTSALKRHKKTHHVSRTYKCTECEYTSVHNSHLKRHKRIHSGLKPHKCGECDYAAVQLTDLKRHQRIHTGLKPYKCTECDYTANQIGYLKMHQRVHTGFKPYKCSECTYTASRMGNLISHQRIHSGVRPYKCSECDYAAIQSGALKAHQRTHNRLKP